MCSSTHHPTPIHSTPQAGITTHNSTMAAACSECSGDRQQQQPLVVLAQRPPFPPDHSRDTRTHVCTNSLDHHPSCCRCSTRPQAHTHTPAEADPLTSATARSPACPHTYSHTPVANMMKLLCNRAPCHRCCYCCKRPHDWGSLTASCGCCAAAAS